MNNYAFINSINLEVLAFDRVKVGNWWNYPAHSSPFARIFLILEGEQKVRFDNKVYIQKPGKIYLVPPFTKVDYSCENSCLQYYIIFSTELPGYGSIFQLPGTCHEFPFTESMKAAFYQLLINAPGYGLKQYNPADRAYNKSLSTKQLSAQDPLIHWQASAVVRLLLVPFLRTLKFEAGHERFIKVVKFMEEHLDQFLSLSDLAEQVALTPAYFSDQFTKLLKVRPMRYMQNLRVERAQLLLTTKPYTVAEVAYKCGFTDACHFCKTFKNHTGLTPKQYRQKGF